MSTLGGNGKSFDVDLKALDGFFTELIKHTKEVPSKMKLAEYQQFFEFVKESIPDVVNLWSVLKTDLITKMCEKPGDAVVQEILQVANQSIKPSSYAAAVTNSQRSPHAAILCPVNKKTGPPTRAKIADFQKVMSAGLPKDQRIPGLIDLKQSWSGDIIAVFDQEEACQKAMQVFNANKEAMGISEVSKSTRTDSKARLIVRGVPKELNEDAFLEEFCAETALTRESVEVVKKYGGNLEDRSYCAFVVCVSGADRVRILKRPRIFVNLLSCPISDFVPQCFKCWRFGHMSGKCPNDPRCGNCGSGEKANHKCPADGTTKCCNCSQSGHGARQTSLCMFAKKQMSSPKGQVFVSSKN